MNETEAMEAIRVRLAASVSAKQTFVPVDCRKFQHLDLSFYDRAREEFHQLGFEDVGDFELVESKGGAFDFRCFIREFISRDGTVMGACFHPKPVWWAHGILRIFGQRLGKVLDVETEFSDDVWIISTTAQRSALLIPPPLFLREHFPVETSPQELVGAHRRRVAAYVKGNPGIAVRPIRDAAGCHRAQNRQHDIWGAYRQIVGGLSKDEIQHLGKFSEERAHRLKSIMAAQSGGAESPNSESGAGIRTTPPRS